MIDIADRPLSADIEAAMFDHRVEDALQSLYMATLDRPYAVTWSYAAERDRFTFTATKGGESQEATVEGETLGDGGWRGVVSGFDTRFLDQAASSK